MAVYSPRSDDLPTPSTTGPVIDLPFDYVDFEGPCANCGTDCIDEWERMFDRKFTSGFIVDQNDADKDNKGGLLEQLLFSGGSWPQYSTKGQTYSSSGEYTTIFMSSEVKVGDIRVAYTDHWIAYEPGEGEVRTFMKRPEEYWAAKANPYGSRGRMSDDEWIAHQKEIDEKRLEWIRCRHTHTDHQHNQTLGGGSTVANPSTHEYPIVVDDCITGIWDYNLVDTCTTIEKFGIYEAVNFYEVFPACGATSKKSPPLGSTGPLIHVLNFQPMSRNPEYQHDHAGCGSEKHRRLYEEGDWFYFMGDEPGHEQPCDCSQKRSQYGKTVMAITSPWCDHTLARFSKSPHRVGIGHEPVSGVSPPAPNAPLYDNEGEHKTFGAVSETFLFKVGEFYKTTIRHFGSNVEPFQAPSGAKKEMWTLRHPEEPGNGPEINSGSQVGGGCWCTNPFKDPTDQSQIWQTKYCAKMLLQLPCATRPLDCSEVIPAEYVEDFERDGDGVQCCENWDPEYCEEQSEHIYYSEADVLDAFDRDNRYKSADFTKNNTRPRIHPEGDPIRCQTSQIYGWVWLLQPCEGFGQDKWERMYNLPSGFEKNCSPGGRNCRCSQFPGGPPETGFEANVGEELEVASAWETAYAVVVSLLWGIDGVDFGKSCTWSQKDYGFSHCSQQDGFLVGVGFFEGNFRNTTSGEIDWKEIAKSKLHPPKTIPKKDPLVNGVVVDTPWSEGGMHDDMVTSIAAWTNFDSTLPEQTNSSFSQEGQRFQTDYEAAEVFYKAAGTQYWYKGVSKKGEQLTGKYGELDPIVSSPSYLATDEMDTFAFGARNQLDFRGKTQPPRPDAGDSPCGTPERVATAPMAKEFAPFSCDINDPVDGCNDEPTNIFTGVGDPAPRFDEKQRINYYGECTQAVDELFGLTKKLTECIEESDITILGKCIKLSDDSEVDLKKEDCLGPVYKWVEEESSEGDTEKLVVDNCNNLYFVHKPFIKLAEKFYGDEEGFFVCGIPIGNVPRDIIGTKGAGDNEHSYCDHPETGITMYDDDNLNPMFMGLDPKTPQEKCSMDGGVWKTTDFGAPEYGICDATFSGIGAEYAYDGEAGNIYCGLQSVVDGSDTLYHPVSCTSCENYECQERADVYNLPSLLGTLGYKSCDSVHCCQWLVHNPSYDPAMPATPLGHPDVPDAHCQSNVPFCAVPGYKGGHPHQPFHTGFVWHTVLGWHPDTALDRGRAEYRYNCSENKVDFVGNEANHIFDCCDANADENVPCNVLTVPKQYETPEFEVAPAPVPKVSLA